MKTWRDLEELIENHSPFQTNTISMYLNDFFKNDLQIRYHLEAIDLVGMGVPVMSASLELYLTKDTKPQANSKKKAAEEPEAVLDPIEFAYVHRTGYAALPNFTPTGITTAQLNALLNAMEQLGANVEYATSEVMEVKSTSPSLVSSSQSGATVQHSGPICEDCNKPIEGYERQGKDFKTGAPKKYYTTAEKQAENTKSKYGRALCKDCGLVEYRKAS